MKKHLKTLSLLIFIGLNTIVFSQTKGIVNDENGFPEVDVEVSIKGTDNITYTDDEGKFEIDTKVGDILIINGIEYNITGRDLGIIKLKNHENIDLEETVITAYGTQKKETIVGSNTQIKAEQFEDRPLSNVVKVLDGAAPGVLTSTGSGQPGSGIKLQIRGTSSYKLSNDPLYIVDGAIYTGDISDLNPNDIASLNILKDAASTSLYGSSAANGVVMITTKKGSKLKKGTFNFTANTGVVTRGIPQYERMGPDDYYIATWEAMRNGRLITNPTESIAEANAYASNNLISGNLKNNIYNVPNNQVVIDGVLNPNAKKLYDDFDWDKYLDKVGSTQNYSLNFSDATDRSTFYSSFSYNKEEGYVIKSDFERYNARVSGDSQVTNWLKLGVNLNGNLTKSNQLNDSGGTSFINPFFFSRRMGPIYSPFLYDSNGHKVYDQFGNVVYDGIRTRGRGGAAIGGRNVLEETLLNNQFEDTNAINSRGFAEFKIIQGLIFTTNISYDVRNYSSKLYQNKYIGNAAGEGSLSETTRKTQSITFNQLLNYTKSFDKHNFSILLGHESFERQIDFSYRNKTVEVMDGIYEFNNFLKNRTNTSYNLPLTKESYFARLNYDFSSKYLLSASIRQDQSSRFDPKKNKGTFWSTGIGWNIFKEDFLKDSNIINFLKLRSSYGEVGNDGGIGENPGYFADLNLYNLGDYFNADEPGVYLEQTGNKDLTWEKNAQLDVALEFGILNDRITGSIEYFRRETKNMIFPKPQPGSAGEPNNQIFENVGTMRNTGWEFGLNFGIIQSESFIWNLGITGTTFKSKMIKMPGSDAIIDKTKRLSKGHSLYDFWLREWYGVDPADGAPLFVQDPTKTDTSETRVIDGKKYTTNYNNANFAYAGSSIPDLYGSINNEFKYKNFSLTTLFTYQIGGKVYDNNYATLMNSYPQGQALHKDMQKAWKNPGDITNVPILSTQNYIAASAESSRFLQDADYFMLKNTTLGYSFNKKDIESLGLSNLKLFISGENLFAITAMKGLEPVQSFDGTTSFRYTPARVVSFGINLSF